MAHPDYTKFIEDCRASGSAECEIIRHDFPNAGRDGQSVYEVYFPALSMTIHAGLSYANNYPETDPDLITYLIRNPRVDFTIGKNGFPVIAGTEKTRIRATKWFKEMRVRETEMMDQIAHFVLSTGGKA